MNEERKKNWNDRYKENEYYYGKAPNLFLKEMISYLPRNGDVLCLAEGEGRNAVFLAQNGFKVTAVDCSNVGLEKTQRLADEKKVSVSTIQADLETFEIGFNKWDAIISIWCHTPRVLRQKIHNNVQNGLKDKGCFILEAYHPKQLNYSTGGPKDVDLLVTLGDLRLELSPLQIKVARECERIIEEGKGHSGLSSVVQYIGVKI